MHGDRARHLEIFPLYKHLKNCYHFWPFQTIPFFDFSKILDFFGKKTKNTGMKSSISKISARQLDSLDNGKNYRYSEAGSVDFAVCVLHDEGAPAPCPGASESSKALLWMTKAKPSPPLTLLGGAGSLAHLEEAVRQLGTIGLAAGSLFVFKGQYRAVLINYPSHTDRAALQQQVAPSCTVRAKV